MIAYYLRRIELPYALSWWAFTFPTGALAVSTGVAWKASGFGFIHFSYIAALLFLLVVWLVVLVQTGKGVISGKIFAPPHSSSLITNYTNEQSDATTIASSLPLVHCFPTLSI